MSIKNVFNIKDKSSINKFKKTLLVSFFFCLLDYFFVLQLTDWTGNFKNYSVLSLIWSCTFVTLFYSFITMLLREKVSFLIGFLLVFFYSIASFFKNLYLGSPIVVSDLIFAREISGLTQMIGIEALNILISLHLVTFVIWFSLRYTIYSILYNSGLFSLILNFVKIKSKNKFKELIKISKLKMQKNETFFIKDSVKISGICFISLIILFFVFPMFINWNTFTPDVRTYIHSYGVIGGLYGEYLMSKRGPDPNYSEEKAIQILSTYEKNNFKTNLPENMDIVVVLSEAFWNPENIEDYDIRLKKEYKNNTYKSPYEPWEKLSNQGLPLKLNVPIYAGITVNTEYEFFTGYSFAKDTEGYIAYSTEFQTKNRNDIPSIVKEFEKNNYNTIAISPFDVEKIYGCDIAYKNLGFDKTYLWSNYYEEAVSKKEIKNVRWFYDRFIFDKALSYLTENKDFIFVKTVENHMPYYSIKYEEEEMIFEVNGSNKEWCETIKIYSNGIYNSGIALENLWKKLKENNNPTMLIVFGDHLPALTDKNGTDILFNYLNKENSILENNKNKYTTDCLILTNFDYEKENLFANNQRDISPWLLGSTILKNSINNDNVWFDYIYNYGKEIPVMTKKYIKDSNNNIYNFSKNNNEEFNIPKDLKEKINNYFYAQWYTFEE